MSRREWKARLTDMQEVGEKILSYCREIKNVDDFAADSKTADACIRNLQILGDAVKAVPSDIQSEIADIPWKEIKGMRNILVHEYFGVSPKIIWSTISQDLPKVVASLKTANARFAKPSHPWKVCPPGEYYVRDATVKAHLRKGHPVRTHPRRDFCRHNQNSGKDVLTFQEAEDISEMYFGDLSGPPAAHDLGYKKAGNQYDSLIRGWVKYWNDIFQPTDPLDPDVVKALIATESSFNPDAGKKKRGSAKGLMQLLPQTINYLQGARKELSDHLFEFNESDIYDPNLNIACGVRWLFRKRSTASARLGRQATWEETVAEYKDYLRRKLKNPNQKQAGMDKFLAFLKILKANK